MKKSGQEINAEIESALSELARLRGEAVAGAIRPIIHRNHQNKRVQFHLNKHKTNTVQQYIDLVADKYLANKDYLYQIQVLRTEEAWEPLFETLSNLTRKRLFKNGMSGKYFIQQWAEEYATKVAIEILRSQFTYDDSLDAWMTTIVRNVCAKGARSANAGKRRLVDEAIELDLDDETCRSLDETRDAARKIEDFVDLRLTLNNKLTAQESKIIQLYYEKGLTEAKIAQRMNCSTAKINRMHKNIIANLREFLL